MRETTAIMFGLILQGASALPPPNPSTPPCKSNCTINPKFFAELADGAAIIVSGGIIVLLACVTHHAYKSGAFTGCAEKFNNGLSKMRDCFGFCKTSENAALTRDQQSGAVYLTIDNRNN